MKPWVALPAVALLLNAIGFSQSAGAPARPTFAVATIKPDVGGSRPILRPRGDGLTGTSVTTHMLITWAYGNIGVERAPDWIDTDRYTLEAKVDADDAPRIAALSADEHQHQLALRLQSLLADRFKLALHLKPREVPAYALTALHPTPALKRGSSPNPDFPRGTLRITRGQIVAEGIPIERLVPLFTAYTHRPVLDSTGLTGTYSFTVQWEPDGPDDEPILSPGVMPPAADSEALHIVAELQEQLGLKLTPTKTTVQALIIDHIEKPSAN